MNKWMPLVLAALSTVPGLLLRLGLFHGSHPLEALLYGIAIVGCGFLLSWAAEVFQLDISQGLALTFLALIAILPEYVVDATFAWKAAEDPVYAGYATANMTGANRLLIGLAWPLVVGIYWFRTRQRVVSLRGENGLELIALFVATLYAFLIPLKRGLSWVDLVVLVTIFLVYVWRVAKLPASEPHLMGPAATIATLPTARRRVFAIGMAVLAAIVVLLVAEPFAEALVATGAALGVDEFLLVQWLAPLASEAPEFVVVCIFAWRAAASAALGALVSSTINQWTLLVSMLPLIYAISLGRIEALPLDRRQQEEVWLTAAQSLFALALLLDLRLSVWGAGAILGLFVAQFVLPEYRIELSIAYVVLSVLVVLSGRRNAFRAFRAAVHPEEMPPESA